MQQKDTRPSAPNTSPRCDLSPMWTSYCRAIKALDEASIPFLVGGAYALHYYTGIWRDTKDLDVFVRPEDHKVGLDALAAAGYRTVLSFPHWLGKATWGEYNIDIIFSSGNAIGKVDDSWFRHAVDGKILGLPVKVIPAEEMIWSKAFVMERERYDGADVMHILAARLEEIDWNRLLDRFGPHWRVLLSYLILFGFVYPSQRSLIPAWLMEDLMERLESEMKSDSSNGRICQGTLLSRTQYQFDIEEWGYLDARLPPMGAMSEEEIEQWNNGPP